MNSNVRALAGLAASVLLVSTSAAAFAQETPPGPPSAQAWKAHAKAHAEARIHALHDLLNIHPDQEAAFQTFIAAMHPTKDEADRKPPEPGEMAHLTTPERLDRISARMAEHQARFQAMITATKTFYAALTPEQQRAFDALPPMMGRGPMGHGHGGGGWGGHHGGWDRGGPPGPPPAQ